MSEKPAPVRRLRRSIGQKTRRQPSIAVTRCVFQQPAEPRPLAKDGCLPNPRLKAYDLYDLVNNEPKEPHEASSAGFASSVGFGRLPR
jgi:hypothetical protein